MKKINFYSLFALILSFVSITLFSSCNDDNDSENTYGRVVTVMPLEDNSFYLVTDDGKTLWPENGKQYKPKPNQRAAVYYTPSSAQKEGYDYTIKIRNIGNLLTKGVIDLDITNKDSIGNDPIRILRYWIGDNYLNIEFGYNHGSEQSHYINLANNTTLPPASDGKIHLEFRHNANKDPQLYGTKGLVAFDLRPYIEEGKKSVDLVVKVQDFEAEKTYTITYVFGKGDSVYSKIDDDYTSEAN